MVVQIPRGKRAIFGERGVHYKVYGFSAVSCAKTAEPIEMWFGLWTRVGPRKHVLEGAQIPHVKGQLLSERTCSGGPKEAHVQSYSPGVVIVPP